MSSQQQYRLIYFNAKARGELIRWCLSAGGLKWKDERVEMQDWPAMKPSIASGQLPCLMTPEGHELSQTVAIARYVAKKSGLVPRDDFGAYKCDMIVDFIFSDVIGAVLATVPMRPPEEVAKAVESWNTTASKNFLGRMQGWVQESRTGYLVGDRLTWADLAVAVLVNNVSLNAHLKDSLKAFPELTKFTDRIAQSGKLADYIKSRPDTMF